jgi:hypothetical protein
MMAFEHPTSVGVVELTESGRGWTLQYAGRTHGRWNSPDAAAEAVARHETGLPEWDNHWEPVSPDIIDWRPLGASI